ncbi:hypothetical protein HK405_013514, partial [Cladochytrium tenue]
MLVWASFEPRMPDEIALKVGDQVVLNLLHDDGWAHGTNLASGESGMVPIAVLVQDPSSPPVSSKDVARIQHSHNNHLNHMQLQEGTI